MRPLKHVVIVTVVLFLSSIFAKAGAQLPLQLLNPSFELPAASGPPDDWTFQGSASRYGSSYPKHDGSYCLGLGPTASGTSATQFSSSIAAGDQLVFSGWVYNQSAFQLGTGGYGVIEIAFLDGGGNRTSSSGQILDPTPDQWLPITASGTAPVGTIGVEFAIKVGPEDAGGTLFFDDLSLSVTPVPEPVNVALILFGVIGIGCIGYRRLRNKGNPE